MIGDFSVEFPGGFTSWWHHLRIVLKNRHRKETLRINGWLFRISFLTASGLLSDTSDPFNFMPLAVSFLQKSIIATSYLCLRIYFVCCVVSRVCVHVFVAIWTLQPFQSGMWNLVSAICIIYWRSLFQIRSTSSKKNCEHLKMNGAPIMASLSFSFL